MKKMLLTLGAICLMAGGSMAFAADEGPCVKPTTEDAAKLSAYEACMAEYEKAMKLEGAAKEEAMKKAEAAMNAVEVPADGANK